MGSPAGNSLEHTLAHLARLDLLIRREVIRLRLQQSPRADDEFRGLYISEEEVDGLLAGSLSATDILSTRPLPNSDTLTALETAIAATDRHLAALEDSVRGHGEHPCLNQLGELFGLSGFERQVVVICLAAEIDLKYERLFAYLQDDVTKKRPTVDLVMRLLCSNVEARLATRRSFEPTAPLIAWQIVTMHDDPNTRRPVLPARYLKLDDRITGFLLGSDTVDARLLPLQADPPDHDEALTPEIRSRLLLWGPSLRDDGSSPVILFHGRYGTGKRAATRALAQALAQPLLLLNASDLPSAQDSALEQTLRLAEREARLRNAILGWDDAGPFLNPAAGAEVEHRVFVHALGHSSTLTVLLAEKAWEPARELSARPFLRLEMPEPTYAERRHMWAASLDGGGQELGDLELSSLSGRFRLTAGQIRDAVSRARTLAWSRDPGNGHIEAQDIDAACRTQAQHRLGAMARKLEPRYAWEDIVLPRPQLAALRLICTTIRQRPVVYGDWGFDRKLSLGKGLIALFAGPSGTGKTMAAEIIAHELGLDVYKIDLSAVVSKYIGETEKNLERIFGEAQDTDAILFFDEADALFGKRSEVKDAHDRYANIEIAYLLQRTEEYNGLVILASNIKKNMDEAFIRRLHFTVDFPFPEEAERIEIWRRTFPAEAPRGDDIDLAFLARKFKITGGSIRNIILTAAFLAAEERQPIAMRQLVRAAGYEFQKMGKLVVEVDFEQYFGQAKT